MELIVRYAKKVYIIRESASLSKGEFLYDFSAEGEIYIADSLARIKGSLPRGRKKKEREGVWYFEWPFGATPPPGREEDPSKKGWTWPDFKEPWIFSALRHEINPLGATPPSLPRGWKRSSKEWRQCCFTRRTSLFFFFSYFPRLLCLTFASKNGEVY